MVMQLVRFAGVGVLATLVHICTALVAYELLSFASLWANFAGFAVAVFVSYFGHARITFKTEADHGQQFPRFLFVALVGLATSSSVVWLNSDRLGHSFGLSMLLVAIAVPLVSFFAMKFFVFAQHKRRLDLDWGAILIVSAFVVAFLSFYWSRLHHHDVAWYLVATRKMLDGAVLYRDIIEINPPLNFYLTIPAVLLADMLNLSLINGQYVFVALMTAVSLIWSNHILRNDKALPQNLRYIFIALAAFAITVSAINNIAQREHILVIFLLPWLVGHLSPARRTRPILRAVIAAIAVCLKPYFLIFPFLMLCQDIWRNRSLRPIFWPEYLAMLAVLIAFVAFVALVHPLYFSEIVPTARAVYGVFGTDFSNVVAVIRYPLLLSAVVVVTNALRPAPGSGVFILAMIAGLISYLAQAKGFLYHLVPLISFQLLFGVWVALSSRVRRSARLLAVATSLIIVFVLFAFSVYKNAYRDEVIAVAKELGVTRSIMTGSTELDAGPPAALALGVEWTSRYPHTWIYPGALERRRQTNCVEAPQLCAEIDAIMERDRSRMMDDLLKYRPELIVSSRVTSLKVENPLAWYDFMSADSRFKTFMQGYELVKRTDWFDYHHIRDQ